MTREPYKLDSFKELMHFYYGLAWYSGRKTLFTLRMEGEFEGFSGRASESWETCFVVETEEFKLNDGKMIPAVKLCGDTLDDVCKRALDRLTGSATLWDEEVPI